MYESMNAGHISVEQLVESLMILPIRFISIGLNDLMGGSISNFKNIFEMKFATYFHKYSPQIYW